MFVWRYLDHMGQELGHSEGFDDRDAAEAWLGLMWADLSSNGIEEVELMDEERHQRMYRMDLAQEPAEP